MDGGSWHCTGDRNQDDSQEKEMQKSKMVVWGGITNSCEKKGSKKQRRKGQIYPFECRVPKKSKERLKKKKVFFSDQCHWFMSMHGKKTPQYCKVISLQLNKLIKKKQNWDCGIWSHHFMVDG